MASESAPTRKFVPGAPPPPPPKASKKKRRGVKKDGAEDSAPQTPAGATNALPDTLAAALTDHAPTETDVKQGAVADELIAKPETKERELATPVPDSEETKPSPVIEVINKRLKTIGKKITRIQAYSDKPVSELNEDQKKTLATLPTLEAVKKELEETRKAIESVEAEQAKEAARDRAEAEKAEKQRIEEIISEAQREHVVSTAKLLDIIRLQSLLINSDPSIQALNVAEAELNAIYTLTSALLSRETTSRYDIMHGFLRNEGDIEGVPFARLLEILDTHTNQPIQDEIALETAEVAEAVLEALAENVQETVPVNASGGIPATLGAPSFQFMQESELDNDTALADNNAEWEERELPSNIEVSVEITETYVPEPSEQENGNALNWADDEGGLPSIDGLHASFGTAGSAPPNVQQPKAPENPGQAPLNGIPRPTDEEDGFQQARGGRERGRGRGRGGFRGGERGGFRGERGGFRGGRGGRGRPGPGHEGSQTNWRGGPDGEHRDRGRGRGRGRGGFDRERGGARGGRGGNIHPESNTTPPNA